ncbi:MAG: M24 family metallopeptidase [Bacillota bacterium]
MTDRVQRLREVFEGEGLDGFLVTRPENRYYLTGFTGSAGSVLVTGGEIYLVTDFRYAEQARIQSPHCRVIVSSEAAPDAISKLAGELNINMLGCEGDHLTYHQFTLLGDRCWEIGIKPLAGVIDGLRTVKDSYEIEKIGQAVDLSDRAFSHILPFIVEGAEERDIALELEFFMRKEGAEGVSFPIIVASGERSSMPHGIASGKRIAPGDLVTMDFGAMLDGYNSDITRTVVLGAADEKQKKIYQIVLEAQLSGIKAVRAGIKASEVDRAARSVIEAYGYGEHFGHSTGHGVGLQIHENPRVSSKDDTELKPGMVITIEPGIYLPGWGGVRIEDTVVVEDRGCRVLTKSMKDGLIACGA